MTDRVVVGSDGSPFSASAVTWAMAEARLRGADLCVVGPCPDAEAAAVLTGRADVSGLVVVGVAGAGSRQIFGGKALGSVAESVIGSSRCPVVIVPPAPPRSRHRRVVVGVDGRRSADAALGWAVEEADLLGAALIIVHAWFSGRGDGGTGSHPSRDVARNTAAAVLDAALETARAYGAGDARGLLLEDGAARAILANAERADLLAIGTAAGPTARSNRVGSVARSVISKSPCPVVSCPPIPTHPTAGEPV